MTALAGALAVLRLAVVVFASYPAAVGTFDDDAFYYFGIARHLADGAGSTFNGVDPTNGYHPLWLLVLVPVFLVANGKTALVLVTVVSAVLFVLSARLIDRIGRLTGRPVPVFCAATPLLVTGTAGPLFWFSGMETGLLLFSLLWLATVYLRTNGFLTANPVGAGALMTVVVLARLDAVVTLALLGVLALAERRRAGLPWLRFGLRMLAVPAVVLSCYVVVNVVLFGTALPVSGQAKALGANGINAGDIAQFFAAPVVFGRASMLGALAVVVVVGALLVRAAGALGLAARFGAVVLAGGVLTVVYYAVTSSWQLWSWYFSAAPLAIALAGPALLDRWAGRTRALALALLVLVLCATSVAGIRSVAGGSTRSAFTEAGPRVAAEIDALTPPGAPIAMGDRAGSVGYHSDRPLIHLEGLVNSAAYLDALAAGTVPRFLAERGVAFYARGDDDPGRPAPGLPGCVRFGEPQQGGVEFTITVCAADLVLDDPLSDGTSYRVWRYRTSLNR